MKRIYKYLARIIVITLALESFQGCDKFVATDLPSTKLSAESVFKDDATATAATLSMYEVMMRVGSFSASGAPGSIACIGGIYADEFTNYYNTNSPFAENIVEASNSTVMSIWSTAYTTIFSANAVIEGLAHGHVSQPLKNQLEGEARLVRAYCHFYLTNLFGDVPLVTTTDYRVNAQLGKSSVNAVYDQIIDDLQRAAELLSPTYITAERARPTAWSARALLARVYLYQKNWVEAEKLATSVIEHSTLFKLESELSKVFVKTSNEAIWQLASTDPASLNTYEGYYFVLTSSPQIVAMSNALINSFETGDQRRVKWVGSYSASGSTWLFVNKYKLKNGSTPPQEHSILLRLSEQFLIRAEARVRQGKLSDASADLNVIRTRAGLGNTIAITAEDLLLAIEKERRVELFGEWTHRWFDLKRTGRATEVLGGLKPGWDEHDILFPIPEKEIITNGNLLPQNPGY